jgi:tetratricopeptide (TPR) repeat protein
MPVNTKRPAQNPWLPWQVLAIVGAVFWIYWPALNGAWQWDDDLYLTKNPLLNDPARLWKAWFVPGSFIEYYPIAQTVQWVQWQLWHEETFGYHVTNVLLHAAGALLVWRLLAKLGLRYAWLGGMLFAVHPAQVESVAWISEIKNTLSLPPFLLAMCAWIDYDERRSGRGYAIAFAWFVVAMLCKISMAPFAFVILLYAWWKRGRVGWTDVKEAAPFLVVAVFLAAVTVYAGNVYARDATTGSGATDGLVTKLALAGSSMAFYLAIFFWPVDLLPAYAKWTVHPPSSLLFLPWFVLLALVLSAWKARRTWGRHVLLGLGFFLLLLAPFLGLHWVSYMDFTWVMNHFLYIPGIGLIGLLVAGLEKALVLALKKTRQVVLVVVGVFVVMLAFAAQQDAALYLDPETLWTYTEQHDPKSYAAHNQLGVALHEKGDAAAALDQFEQALALQPDFEEASNNVGTMLLETGRATEAADAFRQAVKLDPGYAIAHFNLGNALRQGGQLPEAIAEFQQSLKLDPLNAEAENNLADALLAAGRNDEAFAHFARAAEISPTYAGAQYNWGVALLKTNDVPGAITHFQRAIAIQPDYVEAHFNLGVAFYQTGHMPEAIAEFQAALRLRPGFSPAQNILSQLGALPGK